MDRGVEQMDGLTSNKWILSHDDASRINRQFGRHHAFLAQEIRNQSPESRQIIIAQKIRKQLPESRQISYVDETMWFGRCLSHTYFENDARLVYYEDTPFWWHQFEIDKKETPINKCVRIDGTPKSIWEYFFLNNLLSHKEKYCLSAFNKQSRPSGCTNILSSKWLTDAQYQSLRIISLRYPSVCINKDGSADVYYFMPINDASCQIAGLCVKQHAIGIFRQRLDLSTLIFSEPELVKDVRSSISHIEKATAQFDIFSSQFKVSKGCKWDRFKYKFYVIKEMLFLPIGFLMIPLTIILTNFLGLICGIPIVSLLLIFTMTLIWLAFCGLLLILSTLQAKCPVITLITAPLGLPVSILAQFVVGLFPDLGEKVAKAKKMMPLEMWPFTFEAIAFLRKGIVSTDTFAQLLRERSKLFPFNMYVIKESMGRGELGKIIEAHNESISPGGSEQVYF